MDPNGGALPVPDAGSSNALDLLALAAVEELQRERVAFEEQQRLLEELSRANWERAAAQEVRLRRQEEEKLRLVAEEKKYQADLERNEEARTRVVWGRASQRRDEIDQAAASAKQYEADLRRVEEERTRIVWDRAAVLRRKRTVRLSLAAGH
jgi:hypothetical protein